MQPKDRPHFSRDTGPCRVLRRVVLVLQCAAAEQGPDAQAAQAVPLAERPQRRGQLPAACKGANLRNGLCVRRACVEGLGTDVLSTYIKKTAKRCLGWPLLSKAAFSYCSGTVQRAQRVQKDAWVVTSESYAQPLTRVPRLQWARLRRS